MNNKDHLQVQFCPPELQLLSKYQLTSHVIFFILRNDQFYISKYVKFIPVLNSYCKCSHRPIYGIHTTFGSKKHI